MHMRSFLTLLILLLNSPVILAGVHKTRGHNMEVYEKDIRVLRIILKRDPHDLVTLERLVKLTFTAERFSDTVRYSEQYLGIKRNKEILLLKITSLAGRSAYGEAIKNIQTLLKEYSLTSSEKELLREKIRIFQRSIPARAGPAGLKEAPWGSDKIIAGILQRRSILAGYDHRRKKPFFYHISRGKFLDTFKDGIFSGIDFRDLYLFSASPDEREILASVSGGENSADILYKRFIPEEKKWTPWEKIPLLNRGSVNNYANFTSDGRHVIFVSDRDPGNGLDIYIAGRNRDGQWETPLKVINANTLLDESSVFVHPDNETVYFSSNGRGGSGGYDLYGARIIWEKDSCRFSGITNIREINTFRNEIFPPLINMDLSGIFFPFLKTGGHSVFQGDISYKPRPSLFLDILVLDGKTGDTVDAEIKIIKSSGRGTAFIKDTDKKGYAGFALQRNRRYFVSLYAPGYLYRSENLETRSSRLFIKKRYFLSKGRIKKGYSFTADDIYFDTGSSVIREESYPDLERVYDFMVKNPGVKVRISGNTDNVGTYEYNMRLSRQRADSIVEYLIGKGIPESRMSARGFGFLRNVAPNTTDAERQKNRRVDIEVISSD